MQAITNKLVRESTPGDKAYEISDTELRGFLLRVEPTGIKTWYCQYARGKRVRVADAAVLSPAAAREQARKVLADYVRGIDPGEERKKARAATLRTFIEDRYRQWVDANQRRGGETIDRIEVVYGSLLDRKLGEISAWDVEKIRSARLKKGRAPATVNRDIDTLRAALSRAVEWKLLPAHPLETVKHSKVDRAARVRYLSPDEETRLRAALDRREEERREARRRFNTWRQERGYRTFPDYISFTDHLKPITLLALNTGLRRGELFNLKWHDIDFGRRLLTVVGHTAKSRQTRHIPLNDEAYSVLADWRKRPARGDGELVFPTPDGSRFTTIKTAWLELMRAAPIKGFRFHDTRHDFASKLAMNGTDLNTIRELLGHSDIKMTLRYAHLAPEHKAAAVAGLRQGR